MLCHDAIRIVAIERQQDDESLGFGHGVSVTPELLVRQPHSGRVAHLLQGDRNRLIGHLNNKVACALEILRPIDLYRYRLAGWQELPGYQRRARGRGC